MDQQKFWRRLFTRYVEGKSQPAERKLLDQFFEKQQAEAEKLEITSEEPPDEIRQRMLKNVQREIRPTFKDRFSRKWLAQGVAASLFLGLGYFFLIQKKSESPDELKQHMFNASASWEQVSTEAAEQRQVTLPDGSQVHLNYQSSLRYQAADYGQTERRVYLEGEAFFEVQRDEQRPFIVETQKLTTRVLGTSFNVNTQDNQYVVAVASGSVEVQATRPGEKEKVSLTANQQAALSSLDDQLVFSNQISTDVFLWREGLMAFSNTPMASVKTRLERAYATQIHIDPKLLDRSVTARYQQKPLPEVLDDLCFLLGATYEIRENQHVFIIPQ